MTTQQRWKRAQEYERGYWEGVAQRAAEGSFQQLAFYEWRAGELAKRLNKVGAGHLLSGTARVVELGSGPVGLVGYLPAREKVAVDPLNRFYATNQKLTQLRKPDVRYLDAPGEQVPLASGAYDLVVMENCIDHVRDMGAVMAEIRRLLTDRGLLYLTVNARSRPGYFVHRMLAKLALDPGHPHTFTERRFQRFLDGFGFDILLFHAAPWLDAWLEDLRSSSSRARLKALLFVSEHLLSAVVRKRELGTHA
jgi:SAM-dependent methyltransferase